MSIIGQPSDYSDILKRVFVISNAVGLICTVALANVSPAFKQLFDSISTNADIGPLKNLKALYVVIPLIIALVSRMVKLHDIISDLFKIRFNFDTNYILYPLAEKSGLILNTDLKRKIRLNRIDLMYKVFYPYASFKSPVIDDQLVRNAADNWGWFWVLVESSLLVVITTIILILLNNINYVILFLLGLIVISLLIIYFWNSCKRGAEHQIVAILDDPIRKEEIVRHLKLLL